MEGLRLRLLFKDRDILSELQKSQGLKRSWLLLKPQQHKTISELSSYLLHKFHLHASCPHGLALSIDGFVLPPFESTCILKNEDIVSVKKKGGIWAVEGNHALNMVENIKFIEKHPVETGPLLLANEEYGNECGGYDSEESEDECEMNDGADPPKETSHLENALGGNAISKKRKASESLPCSKKKHCSEVSEKHDEQIKKCQQDLTSKKRLCNQQNANPNKKDMKDNKKSSESNKVNICAIGIKKNGERQENVEAVPKPEETRKVLCRSTRRKYAQRKRKKEMAKIQKNAASESEGLRNGKELQAKAGRGDDKCQLKGHDSGETDGQTKGRRNWKKQRKWKELQGKAGRGEANYQSKDHVSGAADDQPKGLRNWKQQQTKAKNEEVIGQPKGLLHWKQQHEEDKSNINKQEQANQKSTLCEKPSQGISINKQEQVNQKSTLCEKPSQNSDVEDEVVSAEVSPRHIRFEPLEQASQQTEEQVDVIFRIPIRNDSVDSNKEHSEMLNAGKEAQFLESIDFDMLPFLSDLPKEGHVIAYRLLELSSTCTPELSPYRVGEVSQYNPEAGTVLLASVAEYPVNSSEDEGMKQDSSIYQENGSLEIDFSSLLEVRLVKNGASDPVAGLSDRPSEGPATNESTPMLSTKDNKSTDAPATENGVNLWEQFSETLKAKKAQLSEESSSCKESSGKRSRSYGALRHNALGPTMAFLRSQNEI